MTTYTIPAKQSGTWSIHDIAAVYDREIKFAPGCKYAVVLSSFYGSKNYTTHRTERAAIAASNRGADHSHQIIDHDGNRYACNFDRLEMVEEHENE